MGRINKFLNNHSIITIIDQFLKPILEIINHNTRTNNKIFLIDLKLNNSSNYYQLIPIIFNSVTLWPTIHPKLI